MQWTVQSVADSLLWLESDKGFFTALSDDEPVFEVLHCTLGDSVIDTFVAGKPDLGDDVRRSTLMTSRERLAIGPFMQPAALGQS